MQNSLRKLIGGSMKKIKKFKKISSFWKVEKLQEALVQENIAKALDMIEIIKDDKNPELPSNILNSLESGLLYLLNNYILDKKKVTYHFNNLMTLIEDILVDNQNNKLV